MLLDQRPLLVLKQHYYHNHSGNPISTCIPNLRVIYFNFFL